MFSLTVGNYGGSLKAGWGEDRDNDCCYNEFEVLWNIHSEMLNRKLDVLDGKSEEPVRDFSKEMASRGQGICELARNRVTESWESPIFRKLEEGKASEETKEG